jgi:ABC-2 type transport system permease protein
MTTAYRLTMAEWTKLRSLRSTWWTLAAMVVASLGLGMLATGVNAAHFASQSLADKATWDPTNASLSGTVFGQLAIAVFGVLAITGEFASGTIRSSIAAVPRRRSLLAAKAAVYGGVALLAGELISLVSFFVGQRLIAGHAPHATFGQPGVARAVLLAGVYLGLIALLALGVGALLRHTAGAIAAVVAVLLVAPVVTAALPSSTQTSVGRFLPMQIGGSSMGAVVKVPGALPVWVATAMLCLYAAAALLGAGWSLTRRDV